MLLRLAYLGVTNALAMLRLLPISDRAKDAEILALRHKVTVLERQLHGEKVRFNPADRALLAALLRLLVRPETVLCWHRALITARRARLSRPTRAGRHPIGSGAGAAPGPREQLMGMFDQSMHLLS